MKNGFISHLLYGVQHVNRWIRMATSHDEKAKITYCSSISLQLDDIHIFERTVYIYLMLGLLIKMDFVLLANFVLFS